MSLAVAALLVVLGVPPADAIGGEEPSRMALVRRALDELHHERFEAALRAAAELRERFPADAAGPLAEANVYQTMMRDYRVRDHEAEFQAALDESRRLADVEAQSRPDAEAFFVRGTAQGYVAIHDSRCGRWLPALKHGLRCLGDMERASRLDPTFVDPQLPMALHDYWKSRKLGFFFGGRRAGAIARMEVVWREGRYLTVEAAYSLSAVLQGEGQLERALAVNDWLHERFPENPVCLYHRARILERLDRREEALDTWQRLISRLVASGRVSHGFMAECHLHLARLLDTPSRSGTASRDRASAALALAIDHARQREPLLEMDGPFEDFDEVRETIARLEATWAKGAARLRASR
jgi:tetratricopeptide (TPR) repeat protein